MAEWKNWSGWVKSNPTEIARPDSEDDLRQVLAGSAGPLRVVGTGHSFTALAATQGTLVDLSKITGLVSVSDDKTQATIRAGTPIHQLGQELFAAGAALINQGDIDQQTIAGAVSTGTHGTGTDLGAFPSMVTGLRLVTPSGEIIEATRNTNPEVFEAGRLSLGALGVLSQLTLAVRPAYKLKEKGWTMPGRECLNVLDAYKSMTRHFEFFWFPYADDVICKSLEETDEEALPLRRGGQSSRARAEENQVRRMFDLSARMPFLSAPITRFMTRQAGKGSMERHAKAGAQVRWSHEAFPSPRNIKFNEMEWALPAEAGADVLREIVAYVRQKSVRVAFPIEFRYVAADDVWLSPFNGRDSVTVAVHQYHKQPYQEFFDHCELIFRAYEGRPHWGKLHRAAAPDFAEWYGDWDKFQKVRRQCDPEGRILNDHLSTIFGA
jgi:FAD-linked oxidoreductase